MLVVLVEPFEEVGRPTDPRFEQRNAQARESFEDPPAQHGGHGEHDVERELERVELRVCVDEVLVGEASSAGVKAHRYVEVLGQLVQREVLRIVGIALAHCARHGDRHEPEIAHRSFGFRARVVDPLERQ